jgi:hypothetical protein
VSAIVIWDPTGPPEKREARRSANRRAKVRGTSKQLSPEGKPGPGPAASLETEGA